MLSRDQIRERIFATDSVNGAINILANEVGEIGINRFIAGFVSSVAKGIDGHWRRYRHLSFNFPPGWEEGWHTLNAHCPYYHSCFEGRIAFDWESIRKQRDLSRLETKAWQYLAEFELIEGFTVPVHTPSHFGFVTAVGDKNDHGWSARMETQSERLLFLTHVFHEAIRERYPEFVDVDEEVALSARECECLRWAAAGKTTEEVALILGISHETVRVYFKRALRKLGATSRVQAVARAYEENLLT
jgi:LuxR family transcriptional regulator